MNQGVKGKHYFDEVRDPEWLKKLTTFSVGIYTWEERTRGKELKRGAVKVRIKGKADNVDALYEKARAIVELLDAGEYAEGKNISVNWVP